MFYSLCGITYTDGEYLQKMVIKLIAFQNNVDFFVNNNFFCFSCLLLSIDSELY